MHRIRGSVDSHELVRLVPSFGILVVWTVLMFVSGGFRPEAWIPAGMVVAGLVLVSVVGQKRLLPPRGAARTALLLLAAFTAWCFASVAWSDSPGTTLEAADLLLVALGSSWTLALAPWRPRTAELLMVGFTVAAAAACAVALVTALGADDLTSRFEDFRFTPPLDYTNASAAFCFMAAAPALIAASRPGGARWLRALAQGLCTFLVGYALLYESRGSLVGGIVLGVVLLAAVPFRWRLLIRLAVLLVSVVAISHPMFNVYEVASAGRGGTHDALSSASLALVGASVLAVVIGAAITAAEERVRIGSRGRRRARWGAIAAGGLAALALAGLVVAKRDAIGDEIHDQRQSLAHPGRDFAGSSTGAGRLTSADPLERYDYWRVSLDGFRAAPLWGMGAGGFEHRYAIDRRYEKPSRYPHNVVLKVLGDTGLVGTALIVALLAVIAVGLLRGARSRAIADRAVAATAAGVLAYFLVHGMFDWLEIYPVLVGPAFGLVLVALVVNSRADHLLRLITHPEPGAGGRQAWGPRPTWPPHGRGLGPAALAVVVLMTALAVAALGAPWLSLRYTDRAADGWRSRPLVAYADLRRAADVDPLSTRPLVVEGVIALTRGDLDVARTSLNRAEDREDTWLPHFGLAIAAAAVGDRDIARGELARAHALNRRDPKVTAVGRRILGPRKIDPARLIHDVLVTDLVFNRPTK